MYTSNYFATSTRLTLLLLVLLFFSCASPEGITSSKHFAYAVKVLNKDTKEPIQGAEVSIAIGAESVSPAITDVKGQAR